MIMGQIVLSVVVPVVNPEIDIANIRRLIKSLTPQGIEIVIIHDNRTGEMSETLLDLMKSFPRVTLKLLDGNYGSAGEARNAGLKQATGDWISFCDSDDFQRIGVMLEEIGNASSAELLVGQFIRVTQKGEIVESVNTKSLSELCIDPGFWRIAYRRSTLAGIKFSNLQMGEDIVFLAGVLRLNPQVVFTNSVFYEYRVGSPSQSTSKPANFKDISKAKGLIQKQNPNWGKNANDFGFIMRLSLTNLKHTDNSMKAQEIRSLLQIACKNPRAFFSFLTKRSSQAGLK